MGLQSLRSAIFIIFRAVALPLHADRVTRRQRGENVAYLSPREAAAPAAQSPAAGPSALLRSARPPPRASSAPLDMSARKMLSALVAFFVVAKSSAQGPQKYHCANMCVRNELPCPSPCHQCPKAPPCTTPVCPHPVCPHITSLPTCPDPVCGPLPKIPACPTPLVKLSCPHVACPQHSCPACPRCPDILPCPVCPTAPPTTQPTTITTTMATTTSTTTKTTTSATTEASTITTTPTTRPLPMITVTSARTTGITADTQSKTPRIIELITTMGTTVPVSRPAIRTTEEPVSKTEPARTTVANPKASVTPEAGSTAGMEKGTSEPAEETSRALPPGYERTFGVGVFKLFPSRMTWYEANTTCGNDGAYLAIPRIANSETSEKQKFITLLKNVVIMALAQMFYGKTKMPFRNPLSFLATQHEQKDFLLSMASRQNIKIIHVGFHLSPARIFITALGEDMTAEERALWAHGEPSGGAVYACVYLSARGLVSQRCSDRERFVCQLS